MLQLGWKPIVWIASNRIHKRRWSTDDDSEMTLKLSKAWNYRGRILQRQNNRKNLINDVLKGTEWLLRNLWKF